MKICIEYNSLYDAAEACGCEDDFTYEGWEFLENYLDGCYSDDEAFTAVPDLEYDFTEYDDFEEYITGHCGLDIPENCDADMVSCGETETWLVCNDYASGMTDSGSIMVHCGCDTPSQEDYEDFLRECGALPEEEEEE